METRSKWLTQKRTRPAIIRACGGAPSRCGGSGLGRSCAAARRCAELERHFGKIGTSAKIERGRMRAFLVFLTTAAINIATTAPAEEWRSQFLSVCKSGCTQQGGLSADVCSQICNCAASEMQAYFGSQALGSVGTPSVEQQSRIKEIRELCVRRVQGR